MAIRKLEYLKNSRLAVGLTLLIIALMSAGLISREANRTVQVWAAKSNLAPGMTLSELDLTSVSVLLPNSSKNYISAKAQIIGGIVVAPVNIGDLIPVSSIANSSISLNQKLVPITTEINDCPSNISRGNVVDIYAIPNQDSKYIEQPQLIGQGLSVEEVFNEGNSGKLSILVILSNEQVLPILQTISDSRVIIVRSL